MLPSPTGEEVSIYNGVVIGWTTTLDTRVLELVDIIGRTYNHLGRAVAHKGSCELWWNGIVPDEYAADQMLPRDVCLEIHDGWWIAISDNLEARYGGTSLRLLPYAEYLETEHWRAKRREAIRHYGHDCVLCGSGDRVQVHHRRYDNIGDEPLSDLVVLCRKCHARHHDKLGS